MRSQLHKSCHIPRKPNATQLSICMIPGGPKPQRIDVAWRSTPAVPLTANEGERLKECEATLTKGLGTFFEVGSALVMIRDERLYRCTHQTFEAYCRDRWGIGRSYAWRVIGAAERLKLLPADSSLPKPANEFQIRPLLKLGPEQFLLVWEKAAVRANGGRITSDLVQQV